MRYLNRVCGYDFSIQSFGQMNGEVSLSHCCCSGYNQYCACVRNQGNMRKTCSAMSCIPVPPLGFVADWAIRFTVICIGYRAV